MIYEKERRRRRGKVKYSLLLAKNVGWRISFLPFLEQIP